MSIMDQRNIKYIKKDNPNSLPKKRCIRKPSKHSCKLMVDFRTCLKPSPNKNSKIKEISRVTARIEKICEGKIIIGGFIHKIICYKALVKSKCGCKLCRCIKRKIIPFNCFIDIDCKYSNDNFEIEDCKVLCNYSEVFNKEKSCSCSNNAVLVEKDIIKIIVKRIPCTKNCNYYFGNSVVDSEICFVPAIYPKAASVSFDIDPKNFKVMLMCCDLIVVNGVITKTVCFDDGTPPAKKDILVQVNVPASIEDPKKVDANKWKVTQAEICDGCYYFTSPNESETLYHTLIGKDIIAVEVSYKYLCKKVK